LVCLLSRAGSTTAELPGDPPYQRKEATYPGRHAGPPVERRGSSGQHPGSRGGLLVLKAVRRLFPIIERIFADGGYQGEATAAAVRSLGPWQLEIVKRSDHTVGFEVLPQRWIVERTFAWLGRCRRLAKDYENRTRFAVAYIHLATIRLMLRRLTRQTD